MEQDRILGDKISLQGPFLHPEPPALSSKLLYRLRVCLGLCNYIQTLVVKLKALESAGIMKNVGWGLGKVAKFHK